MKNSEQEGHVIERLVHWAEGRPAVRAMLLTSSRANPKASIDVLSDYDVILVVTDIHPFFDRSWLEDFGKVLVVYRDPIQHAYGGEKFAYITQYENGIKPPTFKAFIPYSTDRSLIPGCGPRILPRSHLRRKASLAP